MNQSQKSKKFFMEYWNAINGKEKTMELITRYVEDEKLIEHIVFMEKLFPKYELILDELMAEGNKIFVRARGKGIHSGDLEGVPPTMKNIETPFAAGYKVKEDKIVDFWLIGDRIELLEQMGIAKEEANLSPE